ncbi:hypothetical protein BD289DRAFT_422238 [Coniella lustricola]|uniref:Uncharacterized protein n=1 Tax=Coniella lustricola TaxID=2025994 RepID=A0A2T3AKQ1_9PEZI|nr:hypothetical protein BD289DRAFT_422238 [Coniella lustricola]
MRGLVMAGKGRPEGFEALFPSPSLPALFSLEAITRTYATDRHRGCCGDGADLCNILLGFAQPATVTGGPSHTVCTARPLFGTSSTGSIEVGAGVPSGGEDDPGIFPDVHYDKAELADDRLSQKSGRRLAFFVELHDLASRADWMENQSPSRMRLRQSNSREWFFFGGGGSLSVNGGKDRVRISDAFCALLPKAQGVQ